MTQSNPSSENFGIAKCQTEICHCLDASLAGTLQHRWMQNKQNIKPEILWANFHHTFTPEFETLFDKGINEDWYDVNDPLQK